MNQIQENTKTTVSLKLSETVESDKVFFESEWKFLINHQELCQETNNRVLPFQDAKNTWKCHSLFLGTNYSEEKSTVFFILFFKSQLFSDYSYVLAK